MPMALFIHVPMFGSVNVDSKIVTCPHCGNNSWDWPADLPISGCEAMKEIRCAICHKSAYLLWGLDEPDHLSTWWNAEYCPHRLCQIMYGELCEKMGWQKKGL